MPETLNIFRFDCFDVGIAFEIFGVEDQQIFDVVGFHRVGDFCVMELNAGNGMFDDEFAPVFIDIGCVGKKFKKRLNLFRCKSVSAIERPKPFLTFRRVQTFQNSEIFCRRM